MPDLLLIALAYLAGAASVLFWGWLVRRRERAAEESEEERASYIDGGDIWQAAVLGKGGQGASHPARRNDG